MSKINASKLGRKSCLQSDSLFVVSGTAYRVKKNDSKNTINKTVKQSLETATHVLNATIASWVAGQ